MSASAYPSAPLNYPDIPHPTYPYPPHPTGQTSVEHSLYPNDEGQNGHSALPARLPQPVAGATDGPDARTRLRKACDSCSHRKVKCDEQGPPCRACIALEIPCTFQRPTKRRGPPNKYAEKVKIRKTASPGASGLSVPGSPTHAAHTLASLAQSQGLTAEAICPRPLLLRLIDDYFTYIYPLVPAPHEPTFRASLRDQEDLRDPSFLALLASMVGFLVASYPCKPRQHLKALDMENLYPDIMSLVTHCNHVAVTARGPGYLERELKIHDTLISYLLSFTCAYTFRWPQCELYMGECITISRTLGLHRSSWPRKRVGAENSMDKEGAEVPVNYIDQEMGRRMFWIILAGERSLHQSGLPLGKLCIPPSTKKEPYPPFPSEVDDESIHGEGILPQPKKIISQLVGFNVNLRICTLYNNLAVMDLSHGDINTAEEISVWEQEKRLLQLNLRKVKSMFVDLPRELGVVYYSPNGGFDLTLDHSKPTYEWSESYLYRTYDPASNPETEDAEAAQRRRNFQCEIQRANIYASQLNTRSYIIERYFSLVQAQSPGSDARIRLLYRAANNPDAQDDHGSLDALKQHLCEGDVDKEMRTELSNIVKELFAVFNIIKPLHMKPTGGSFIHKIRQIANHILSNTGLPLEPHPKMYLERFHDLATSFERNHATALAGGQEDAVAEVWAEFRKAREMFVMNGGTAGI